MSFPGGRLESTDAGPLAAALRETEEEIGLARDFVSVAGYLRPHVIITGYWVVPVVGFVKPGFDLRLDEAEVQEAFEVLLAHMLIGEVGELQAVQPIEYFQDHHAAAAQAAGAIEQHHDALVAAVQQFTGGAEIFIQQQSKVSREHDVREHPHVHAERDPEVHEESGAQHRALHAAVQALGERREPCEHGKHQEQQPAGLRHQREGGHQRAQRCQQIRHMRRETREVGVVHDDRDRRAVVPGGAADFLPGGTQVNARQLPQQQPVRPNRHRTVGGGLVGAMRHHALHPQPQIAERECSVARREEQ
ncbi:MAG TPA: CoA pyrophosphatase [Candidatus Peribacteria bacterium]|nr:CoA pyrophosphatase [Candidatus Peribacteria bacterium]